MYADISFDVDAINLQSALSRVSDWAKKWQLTVSIKNVVFCTLAKSTLIVRPRFYWRRRPASL